jgi:hypothetical protein
MKQGSLFFVCHALISQPMSTSCWALHTVGKLSMSKGALTWFGTVWSYGVEAVDY